MKPVVAYGAWWQPVPYAVIIRDLRVQFRIETHLGKEPNKADLVVTTLAPTTRAEFEKKPLIVRLQIGYDGTENLQHLFSGDLRVAATTRNGVDWDTKFQMADAERPIQIANVSRAFAGPTRSSARSTSVRRRSDCRCRRGSRAYPRCSSSSPRG